MNFFILYFYVLKISKLLSTNIIKNTKILYNRYYFIKFTDIINEFKSITQSIFFLNLILKL